MTVAAEWVDIRNVDTWADNPKIHTPEQVAEIAASIKRNGWGRPGMLWRGYGDDLPPSGELLLAGHGARLALLELLAADPTFVVPGAPGVGFAPMRCLDLPWDRAVEMALADNQIGTHTGNDDDLLRKVLAELRKAEPLEVRTTGFTAEELAALFVQPAAAGDGDDDAPDAPPEAEAKSQPGEVYELGPHRLICGSSTDPAVWASLLGDERLRMVWTDPPYGVGYTGGVSTPGGVLKENLREAIANDDLDPEELAKFLRAFIEALLPFCVPNAAWYVAAPSGPAQVPFAVELYRADLYLQKLAWVKQKLVFGRSDYHYKHEDIFYGRTPAGGPGRKGRLGGGEGWFGDDKQVSVLEFDRPLASPLHPTMKPVALVQHGIRNSSGLGHLVGDAFGGSGTTLIACALEGRRARLVELSRAYCDVIRKRWGDFARERNLNPGPGAL